MRQQLGAWHCPVQIGKYDSIRTRVTPGEFRQGGLSVAWTCKTDWEVLGKKQYHFSHLQGKTRNQRLIFKESRSILHKVCMISSDSFTIPAKEIFLGFRFNSFWSQLKTQLLDNSWKQARGNLPELHRNAESHRVCVSICTWAEIYVLRCLCKPQHASAEKLYLAHLKHLQYLFKCSSLQNGTDLNKIFQLQEVELPSKLHCVLLLTLRIYITSTARANMGLKVFKQM